MATTATIHFAHGCGDPALVGRAPEELLLRAHLESALMGQGRTVLISGEAGMGKSALADAIGWEAQERGALVLLGQCHNLGEPAPMAAWLDLLRRATLDPDAESITASAGPSGMRASSP